MVYLKKFKSRDLPKTHMSHPQRQWIPAVSTDVKATFERVRQQQAQARPQ